MKLSLPQLLAIFSLACLPNLQAQQAEALASKKWDAQKTLDLLNKIPLEVLLSKGLLPKAFEDASSLEILELYDTLMDIKREVPAHIAQENGKFRKAFINEQGEFKGDSLIADLQHIAGTRVGRILGCTLKEMNNGTCQPLKDSNDPEITPDEKAAMPFAETTGAWTKDWVHLLPMVEIFQKGDPLIRDYYDQHINFMRAIALATLANELTLEKTNALSVLKKWKINFLKKIDKVNNTIQTHLEITSPTLIPLFRRTLTIKPLSFLEVIEYIYLSTLPDSLQNSLLTQIKKHYFYWDLDIPCVLDPATPYLGYQVNKFLKRDERLKLENMTNLIEFASLSITKRSLDFVYDNTPYHTINKWLSLKNS